jgi:hypothetical protein
MVRLQATLCPDAKEPDDRTQDDRPAKKTKHLPKKEIQTMFRNRCP